MRLWLARTGLMWGNLEAPGVALLFATFVGHSARVRLTSLRVALLSVWLADDGLHVYHGNLNRVLVCKPWIK